MKIVITGSRKWVNRDIMYLRLLKLPKDTIVIEGEADGADKMAREISEELGFKVVPMPAPWDEYGKAAGGIRNNMMLALNPVLVIAFIMPGIKGTKDCINKAGKLGIEVEEIHDTETCP